MSDFIISTRRDRFNRSLRFADSLVDIKVKILFNVELTSIPQIETLITTNSAMIMIFGG
jgi:hypothetical protein